VKLSKADILCAGGIVWRLIDGVEHVGVVTRTRYGGDCALPKGHVESGESVLDAALREVAEELGVACAPLEFAGAVSYPVDSRQKYVLFWNMRHLGDDPRIMHGDEVEARHWLAPAEAIERLTYDADRDLLARCAAARA
jgi:8-oxo-dGTP diphosphatase